MNLYFILKDRKPVPVDDVLEWARWFGTADRQVAVTLIGDVRVSTVFLGMDHSHVFGGPPMLFETMVFGGPLDQEQERCATWQEAETQHELMVARVVERVVP